MKGDGLFSRELGFAGFLGRIGADPRAEKALAARNFLLDEGFGTERRESYRAAGLLIDHGDLKDWVQRHGLYLENEVFCPHRPPTGAPRLLVADNRELCPETFRHVDPSSPFLTTDAGWHLLRAVELDFVARKGGLDASWLKERARAVVQKTATDDETAELDGALAEWEEQIDLRPMFAALYADVDSLFGATPAEDAPGWADTLRDWLGLAHLSPAKRRKEIDILVFRYPVKQVPDLKGTPRGSKPLVPPTVLDGSLSSAFCPAPRRSLTGHTVNLANEVVDPRREVVHPSLDFRARHLWRVGTVTRPVDLDLLPEARGLHLLGVRDAAGRPDYASGTDGDLCG